MEVTEKKDDELICRVKNNGVIKPRKSVNIPNVPINLPSVTERDFEFINWAIDMDMTLSPIRSSAKKRMCLR